MQLQSNDLDKAMMYANVQCSELNNLADFAGVKVSFYANILMYNVVIWQVNHHDGCTTLFEVVGSDPNKGVV